MEVLNPLISIIVPIYNAEKTLRHCLGSIKIQSYRNLEILLINDGSTDGSGRIADEYAGDDARIQVFHSLHEGLSVARNIGLNHAKGSWIAFVDADDWIEPNTFEVVIAHSADVDIICFGRSKDSPREQIVWSPTEGVETIKQNEAIRRLIEDDQIKPAIWDKIYRKELFDGIRFPDGYNYEEIRTTYKLIQRAEKVRLIPDIFYHYIQNKGSIVHTPNPKNRLDHWTACYELFSAFSGKNESLYRACVRRCAGSISSAWGILWKSNDQERIEEIVKFARSHREEIKKDGGVSRYLRLIVALAATGQRWSMYIACILKAIIRIFRPVSVYK